MAPGLGLMKPQNRSGVPFSAVFSVTSLRGSACLNSYGRVAGLGLMQRAPLEAL